MFFLPHYMLAENNMIDKIESKYELDFESSLNPGQNESRISKSFIFWEYVNIF